AAAAKPTETSTVTSGRRLHACASAARARPIHGPTLIPTGPGGGVAGCPDERLSSLIGAAAVKIYWRSGARSLFAHVLAVASGDPSPQAAAHPGGRCPHRLPDPPDRSGGDPERVPEPVLAARAGPHLPDLPRGGHGHRGVALHLPEAAALVRPAVRGSAGRGSREHGHTHRLGGRGPRQGLSAPA